MAKLGKKARKFAKKNLQSVLKKKRKLKSMFKRKAPSHHKDAAEACEEMPEQHIQRNSEEVITDGAFSCGHLDNLFSVDDDSLVEDISDSDGFLSEDSDCPYILDREIENDSEDKNSAATLVGQNKEIHLEIAKLKRKLNRLKEKDPKFSDYLESRNADLEHSRIEEIYSDEEGSGNYPNGKGVSESLNSHDEKILTSCTIDVWCWLVMEEPNSSALPNLLNGFRAACQYGTDFVECPPKKIPNREVFSKILTFTLFEANGIFRRRLGISDSCSKEIILKLKNTPDWKLIRPLLKSYLRSCLVLLNQVTDCQILVFVLARLRESTVFFAAFPSLAGRFIKISVHLWSTGEESLSLSSFLLMRDIATLLGSDCLETCLQKAHNAFVTHCKFAESTNLERIEFLANSIVELYSLDIQRSYQKVLVSLQQFANILRQALKTKKKEELKKIYSWQYINCISLWVKFVTCNTKDHDFQQLLFFLIQVIRGIAHLFPGPRYLPLRFKCVWMLNQLSLASGVFIPVAFLILDCLENEGSSNRDAALGKGFNFSSILKVPKQLLKSRGFHEECVLYAIKLLAAHFAQWSYYISFPEVAAIPLIFLKRFHEKTSLEGLRRPVKRLIDQVEQNVEFIQKKRDQVVYSPNDHASIESFHQLERNVTNASFTQYYTSVLQNSHFIIRRL